jgi:PAS domain-containing protein
MRSVDSPGRDLDLELNIGRDAPNVRQRLILVSVALLAAGLYSLTAASSIPEVIASFLGPVLILVIVWRRGLSDPLAVFMIALIGDAVGVVYGATVRTGLAFAVLLPSVGVAAMTGVVKGRAWVALAAASWAATAAGAVLWLTVGPASKEMPLLVPGTSLGGIMAVGGFGLCLLWRSNRIQERAVATAHEAVGQTAASAAELARTTELLRTVLDASPVPIQAFAPDRTILAWNAASERLFGWSADEVIGGHMPQAMMPAEEQESGTDRIARTMAG